MDLTDTGTSLTVQSPGRINIIGEHTDYNDGFVLPAAVDKKTTVQIARNGSPALCRVTAANFGEHFEFSLDHFSPLKAGWQNYVMGVVHELQQLGGRIEGFDCRFEGDVPIGSGMSSSAALECSLAYALNELFTLGFGRDRLIKAGQMAEHRFVGIKCGIMDQFASMMGKKDHAILLDCRSLEYRYFPLELGNYQLILLNTNVTHALASSGYNTRRAECEEGVALLKRRFQDITHLRDVTPAQLADMRSQMPETIFRRCTHVVSENERVLAATRALSSGDLPALGQLMYRSHVSLQHDYEVSCPELDFLVERSLHADAVLGSRMMGGGFGGCTINLVEKNKCDEWVDDVSRAYLARFGILLTPYSVSIGDGTGVVL
ncbi:MAG: galactokinase [Saprospiraceae bacterium]